MFENLVTFENRYEELSMKLYDPSVVTNAELYRKLMKEQSEIEPIVTKYREYKKALEMIEDAELLLEESDKELRALALEELSSGRETAEKTAKAVSPDRVPDRRPCRPPAQDTSDFSPDWSSHPVPSASV